MSAIGDKPPTQSSPHEPSPPPSTESKTASVAGKHLTFLGSVWESFVTLGNLFYREPLPLEMKHEEGTFEYPLQTLLSSTTAASSDAPQGERVSADLSNDIKQKRITGKLEFLKSPLSEETKLKKIADGCVRITLNDQTYEHKQTDLPNVLMALLESKPPEIDLSKTVAEQEVSKIDLANELIRQMRPVKNPFKLWKIATWFYQGGDSDFSITTLTTVLHKHYGKLREESRNHLLDTLLKFEGGEFHASAPKSLGLFRDTENHMLMKYGSAYLKNQFMRTNCESQSPHFDNKANGLEGKLSALLDTMIQSGPYEFNSKPYAGHTIKALGNLADFAEEPIREKARQALDVIFHCAAVTSLDGKSYGPLRRKVNTKESYSLYDYRSIYMRTWQGKETKADGESTHSFIASYMSYRPKQVTMDLLENKGEPALYRIGHGYKPSFWSLLSGFSFRSSPEIAFSGKTKKGTNYLLTAGGVNRSYAYAEVFSRLTCLMVDDKNATEIKDVFYLGHTDEAVKEVTTKENSETKNKATCKILDSAQKINNTGVYENFACGACPVHVPKSATEVAKKNDWTLYKAADGLYVAVYSKPTLGIMVPFEIDDPKEFQKIIDAVAQDNPNLQSSFQFPVGDGKRVTLHYDVCAGESEWVMKSKTVTEGGQETKTTFNRNFETWPLLTKLLSDTIKRYLFDPKESVSG